MVNVLNIKIPEELKTMFYESKNLLEQDKNYKDKIEQIEQAYEQDDIVGVFQSLDSDDMAVLEMLIIKYTFYVEFVEWFDFVTYELAKAVNIDVSTPLQRLDVTTVLSYCSQKSLDVDTTDKDILIDTVVQSVIEEKQGEDDNPQIRDICALFISIRKGEILPHELADISYAKFILTRKKDEDTNNHSGISR